ncbi:MAG: FtsX-like permease family protein [Ruminococcaceae bacterium]|nr:FtsX-like permease family protein [Oscillospiraceae bacterium]
MGIIGMRISKIGYLIKEGIRGIFLHGFMSFAAVCVTVACLLIVGSFSCLTYNVRLMVEDLNKTNEILVYVDESLSLDKAKSISTQLNLVENVHKATFKSREDALADFVADHEGDEAFTGVEANDLRHRYIVILEDNSLMEETVEEISKISGVAKISASYELAEGFSTLQNILGIASVVVTVVLLIVSLLIIYNTVKLAMYDRKDEIAVMKMVGATNGFIRLPYVVEGFILGMLGAAIAFGLEWLLYDWMLRELDRVDTLQMFTFVPFQELLIPMIVIFSGAGLIVGVVGGWTSIRKFLNV